MGGAYQSRANEEIHHPLVSGVASSDADQDAELRNKGQTLKKARELGEQTLQRGRTASLMERPISAVYARGLQRGRMRFIALLFGLRNAYLRLPQQ
jgi:hypothetical protein